MREKPRTPYGERLVTARLAAKLTQPQLAKKVGMAQGSLGEAETTGQGSKYTAQLARVLGVRAEWLASGDGPMKEVSEWPLSHQLRTAIAELNTQELQRLEGVIRAHLGLSLVELPKVTDDATQPLEDQSVTRKNDPPVGKPSPFLDALPVGSHRASSQSAKVQKPGSSRDAKRAAGGSGKR